MLDSNEPLSARVENYVRYRPGYPRGVLDLLRAGCSLAPRWVVADLGSGSGNLTRLFLENGHAVFAIEPHPQMRAAGERLLRSHPGFVSVAGSAENTSLARGISGLGGGGASLPLLRPRRLQARMPADRARAPPGGARLERLSCRRQPPARRL